MLIINLSETQNDIQIFGNRAVNSAGMSSECPAMLRPETEGCFPMFCRREIETGKNY